jgi:hypothetical protein
VPTLLLANAAAQLLVARYRQIPPWKGGGFGMFSTVDRPHTRTISAEAVTARGERVWLDLGPTVRRMDPSFLSMRRDDELRALAERALRGAPAADRDAGGGAREARLAWVRLRQWRLGYDAASRRLYRDPVGPPIERGSVR